MKSTAHAFWGPFFKRLAGWPPAAWVFAGFALSYLVFFIGPVYLSPAHSMQFFEYVPKSDPIGLDLRQALDHTRAWYDGKDPYTGPYPYTPLVGVVFSPLLSMPPQAAYALVTILTLTAYALMGLMLPVRMNQGKSSPMLLLFLFVCGLLSYGLQFELERGQFNVIAMFCCLSSIWLYHFHHKHWLLAYLLFTLAIQLKIYPAIFAVMFIRDWRLWKGDAKAMVCLGVANLALLFVLGPALFIGFLKAVTTSSLQPYIWVGNHSIRSFVIDSIQSLMRPRPYLGWLESSIGVLQAALLTLVIGCIVVMMYRAHREASNGLNPYLLLGCTIAALLIPAISNDYALSILAAPFAVLLCGRGFGEEGQRRFGLRFSLSVFALCLAYSSTLFSFTNKLHVLRNNLPALMLMLILTTAFALIRSPAPDDALPRPAGPD
jgi:hypothetical protein